MQPMMQPAGSSPVATHSCHHQARCAILRHRSRGTSGRDRGAALTRPSENRREVGTAATTAAAAASSNSSLLGTNPASDAERWPGNAGQPNAKTLVGS